MTWSKEAPQGDESGKVRFDLVPYMNGRVLDLGCGPGKVYPHAIGIDNKIDAKLFGIKVDPDIAVESCERMEFLADGAADTVYSSHLLEHIVDHVGALKEWWRLVKPGGYLVLYLPHRDHYPRIGQDGGNPDHKHDFCNDDITQAMEQVAWSSGQGWEQCEDEVRTAGYEYSFLQVYRKVASVTTTRYVKPQRPEKSLGVVRLGAIGDALWIAGLLAHWKSEGWHITVYTQPQGEQVLRHDPHVDRIICQPHGLFDFGDGKISMWQTAYWLHEERKFDKFVNLIGSTERRLLPQVCEPDFYLPQEQRQRVMNRNYIEALNEWVGITFDRSLVHQKFYPTAAEMAWAAEERAKIDGPLVLINPSGSSVPKWWPYAQELADMLAAERVHSIIVGDLRLNKFRPAGKFGKVIGQDLPIRKLFALAALADVVVGTESALVNSVAYEKPLKIVLMSHSTHENLTRDWDNAIAIEPEGLHCYPCHRIHADMTHCTHDREANAAACQSAAKPEMILQHIQSWLAGPARLAA
jgi:ADP-heptose:LPS heptosyltransferase/predicted SAM-dependent methyltransferase